MPLPVARPSLALLAVAVLLGNLSGCFLRQKKKSSAKSGSALIIREGITFDRLDAGDVGLIKFSTRNAAQCEFAFYSQEPGGSPTRDNPTVAPCDSSQPARTAFAEKIPGLSPDTLYFVTISAWRDGADRATADAVTIREIANTNSSIDSGAEPGQVENLLIARLDIPLRVAQYHHHKLTAPTDIGTVKAGFRQATGCVKGTRPLEAPYRNAAPDAVISGLATRDFAAGNATPHPDSPGRLVTSYSGVNDRLGRWSLVYRVNDHDAAVPIEPIVTIKTIEMESASIDAFDAPQLDSPADPLAVDNDKPLIFRWTTSGRLKPNTYLTIQIGRSGYDKSIQCVFPAQDGQGTIDKGMIADLDEGKHVVLAELMTNYFWFKDGWLVSVFDWRSGRIER